MGSSSESGTASAVAAESLSDEPPVWQNTIAAADQALEEAARIQRGVQQSLKWQQEARDLREALRKAHDELDRYRGMHSRVLLAMRQLEGERAADIARMQSDSEMLAIRHRVYKLLAEHYAITALRLDPGTFARHRERVLQHVLEQRRKGVAVAQLRASDVAFLLL
jgi:small-conductance mechanosensitive channel